MGTGGPPISIQTLPADQEAKTIFLKNLLSTNSAFPGCFRRFELFLAVGLILLGIFL